MFDGTLRGPYGGSSNRSLGFIVYSLHTPNPLIIPFYTRFFFLNMCTNHIEKMTELLNFLYYSHQGSTTQADGKHFCEACGTVIHSQSLPLSIIPKVIFYQSLCPHPLRDQNQRVILSINLVPPSRSRCITASVKRLGGDSFVFT